MNTVSLTPANTQMSGINNASSSATTCRGGKAHSFPIALVCLQHFYSFMIENITPPRWSLQKNVNSTAIHWVPDHQHGPISALQHATSAPNGTVFVSIFGSDLGLSEKIQIFLPEWDESSIGNQKQTMCWTETYLKPPTSNSLMYMYPHVCWWSSDLLSVYPRLFS